MVKNGISTNIGIFDIFLNRLSRYIIRDRQLIFIFFQTWHGNFSQNISVFWMPFHNQNMEKEFHRSSCLYKTILSFFIYRLWTLQVDSAYWSRIHQYGRPHKNSEDNYEDRGFWDPKQLALYKFSASPNQLTHIVYIKTRF